MRKLFLLACLLSWLSFLSAQNNLSGIINSYTGVSAIDNCTSTLTVASVDGFAVGQQVLLIQMQGATINTDNSAAFGTVTSLGSAGLFERAAIAAINGNTITLENTLINQYDPAAGLQLVTFPRYDEAVVTGPVQARSWDGSTGGVIAFEVSGTLTLQAAVVADGAGFRGGLSDVIEDTNCDNIFQRNPDGYRYNRSNWRGAPKGEGIAAPVPNMEVGRGAQANGGGGGNDHNAGGGGGANSGGGGQGGQNRQPGFGCKGNFPGLGGRTLAAPASRIFLGGGGGAGHENNDVGTDGGNGGGIILIVAGAVEGNGQMISSNGRTAATASLGDGAGGGGGGGTIILQAGAVTGGLNLEARGGGGGGVDNRNQDRCFGPGGGGGGGRIITNRSDVVIASFTGGAAGLSFNSTACGTGTNDSAPGNDGRLENVVTIPASTTPAAPPAFTSQPAGASACLGGNTSFSATVSGGDLTYQWQVDRGSGFTNLTDDGTYSGTRTNTLSIRSITEAMGAFRYRLLVNSPCAPPLTSESASITLSPLPTAAFGYTVNGSTVTFDNQSQQASSFRWDFGDGASSTVGSPMHTYPPGGGEYTVILTATNSCGSVNRQATITLMSTPSAAFRVQPSEGCPSLTVTFTNQSSDNAESFRWNFPGGLPESSTDTNPVVTYAAPGIYAAQLIAINSEGSDTFRLDEAVRVLPPPQAGFTAAVSDRTVSFANTSSGADTFAWDFGDGASSTEFNPVHTFSADGVYTVTLTASGECGPDVQTLNLTISTRPQAAFLAVPETGCRPQTVRLENQSSTNALTFRWQFPGGEPATSTDRNPVVTYEFPGSYDVQLIATNAEGSDTLRRPGIITIADRPAADFVATTDQRTVAFANNTTGAATYFWDFGDGNTSSESAPRHTYLQAGRYPVTLTARNDCGSTEVTRQVTAGVVPQANFTADYAAGCAPHLVRFNNTSTGDYESYSWAFPGGDPATSTDPSPQVIYRQPGNYDVTLSVNGPLGEDGITRNLYVKVRSFPEADFSIEVKGDTIFLTNNSSGADRYFWDFGDGNTSTEEEPVYVYNQGGVYTVTLNAQNGSCANALSEVIAVMLTSTESTFEPDALRVFPNPTAGNLTIALADTRLAPLQGRLFNAQGQELWQQVLTGDGAIDLSPFPGGIYFLVLQKDDKKQVVKIVKQ